MSASTVIHTRRRSRCARYAASLHQKQAACRTRFKRSSRSPRARCCALIAPDAVSECSSSEEEEVSVTRRERRADFLEVSLELLVPATWKLVAPGGFFEDENLLILEVRSLLYGVRYAENKFSPGRLLIRSGILALVLAPCKGGSRQFILRCFPSRVESLQLVSVQGLSHLTGGYRRSWEAVSVTMIMTRTNPSFVYSRTACRVFLMHKRMTGCCTHHFNQMRGTRW